MAMIGIICYGKGMTLFWVHQSILSPETPHTVTHVLGVGSLERPPMRRRSLSDVHTRSHTKLGSVPSSGLLKQSKGQEDLVQRWHL